MSQKRKEIEAAIALSRRLRNKLDIQNSVDRLIIHEAYSAAARLFVAYSVDTGSIEWPEYYWNQHGVKKNYADYLQGKLDKLDATSLDEVILAYQKAWELQEKFLMFKTLPFSAPSALIGQCMRANSDLSAALNTHFHERLPWPISFSAIEEMLYWEKGIEADPVDERLQLRDDCESIINCVYPVMCSYWNDEWQYWQIFYDLGDNNIEWTACDDVEDAWDHVIMHIGTEADGFTKEGWRAIFSRVSLETFKRIWKKYEQDEDLMKLIFKKME